MKMTKKGKTILLQHGEIVIYTTDDKEARLDVKLEDVTVWLAQKQMAELFLKEIPTINEHIKNIYKEKELDLSLTIRKFLIVQIEGKRYKDMVREKIK